jgi:hypothetical protein
VTARNTVGISVDSEVLSILAAQVPDTTVNLVSDPPLTTAYSATVNWEDGSYDGASDVIDYTLSYAVTSSGSRRRLSDIEYTVYASGI